MDHPKTLSERISDDALFGLLMAAHDGIRHLGNISRIMSLIERRGMEVTVRRKYVGKKKLATEAWNEEILQRLSPEASPVFARSVDKD